VRADTFRSDAAYPMGAAAIASWKAQRAKMQKYPIAFGPDRGRRNVLAFRAGNVAEHVGSWWHEIVRHLSDVRSRYQSLEITDIATDAASYYTLLLSRRREYLTLIIELEEGPLLIRRTMICKSVFRG
jgi:hypothetical protein